MKNIIFNKKVKYSLFIGLFWFLMVGLIEIKQYKIYEVPTVDKRMIDDEEKTKLINEQKVPLVCNDLGCYDGVIRYYQYITHYNDTYEIYYVYISVNLRPNNENVKSLTNSYVTSHELTISAPIEEGVLINHTAMNYTRTEKNIFNIGLSNLTGHKTDISQLEPKTSFINRVSDDYRSRFELYETTHATKHEVMYVIDVSKTKEVFVNTVTLEAEFRKIYSNRFYKEDFKSEKLVNEYRFEFKNE